MSAGSEWLGESRLIIVSWPSEVEHSRQHRSPHRSAVIAIIRGLQYLHAHVSTPQAGASQPEIARRIGVVVDEPVDPLDPVAVTLVILSGDQRALHAALASKHDGLAVMYLSAIVEFRGDNPDRLALAAHALRELMEKTPKYIAAPVSENARKQRGITSLKEKVRALEQAWATAKRSTTLAQNPWSGELDRPMCSFLAELDDFFRRVNEEKPTRAADARTALHSLDPTSVGLPNDVEVRRVKEWQDCHDYFEGVSHHNPNRSAAEFEAWLKRLEQLLSGMLIPQTFNTFAQLDAIIQEGEENA